jgi:uncharacterized membrane protein YjfL (UPF0719 family)
MLAFLTEMMYWGVAAFFSALFLWQLLSTLLGGIGGTEHIEAGGTDVHADLGAAGHDVAGHDVGGHDAAGHEPGTAVESVATFKLLSVRSVTAFGLLFGWAGVLYLRSGIGQNPTLLYSVLWGVVGMLIVSAIFYFLMRMTETGTRRLATALGQPATVYMDIPAGGAGQIRVMISGAVSFVSARAAGGEALKAGAPVVVKRLIGPNTVEVEKAQP